MIPRIRNTFFDSWLQTANASDQWNANLYLIVRVFLRPYTVSAPPARVCRPGAPPPVEVVDDVRVIPWNHTNANEWQDWRTRFVEVVENGWNNKLWLIPSGFWGVTVSGAGGQSYLPNVRCCLNIVLTEREDAAHCRIRVLRLHNAESFSRSSMHFPRWVDHLRRGISNTDGYLDHLDLNPKSSGQITVLHEMGHYLGLSHVACDSNDDECYGASGSYQAGDLMGAGSRIEAWHAHPWKKRIREHVRDVRWNATVQRPSPAMFISIPPTTPSLPGGVPMSPSDAGVQLSSVRSGSAGGNACRRVQGYLV